MGTHRQPLLFLITTAGDDFALVYQQHYQLAVNVLDGVIDLPRHFAFIAAADPDDDWAEEATWKKANPNYGISVVPSFSARNVKRRKRIRQSKRNSAGCTWASTSAPSIGICRSTPGRAVRARWTMPSCTAARARLDWIYRAGSISRA